MCNSVLKVVFVVDFFSSLTFILGKMKTRITLLIILLFTMLFAFTASANHAIVEQNLTKAVYLAKSGDYELAIIFCNKVIALDPESPQSYFIRGFSYLKLKQYKKAIHDFNLVIRKQPHNADAFYYRGISKKESGKLWGSVKDLHEANKLNPDATQSSLMVDVVRSIF